MVSDHVDFYSWRRATIGSTRDALLSQRPARALLSNPVLFAGPQGDFPGLDQINLQLPKTLAGRGGVDLELTVDGVQANVVHLVIN